MRTVVLEVRSPAESMANFVQSWKAGKPQRPARIGFASPELLWQVLTAKRWELLKVLCGAGPISIREAARRVERNVKGRSLRHHCPPECRRLDRAEGGGIEGMPERPRLLYTPHVKR